MTTNLINNLGGTAGFGEAYLERNDDSYTSLIDIRSVFPNGLNFFGRVWTGIYINNNGNITFSGPTGTFTPTQITGNTSNPIIAAFWADVDTRGTAGGVTPGGTSTGTNLMWYDLDPTTGRITVTWDDVGYYGSHVDKLNAFQLQLVRVNDTDFNIVFRYEDVNWTTGDASGGSGGLGGTIARAGYSSGDGMNFFELPQSGNQAAILDLETSSNVAQPGLWVFQVRSGAPVIEVSIGDLSQAEGNGPGTTVMTFDVILSSPTSQTVQVEYFTQAGTAGAADFIPVGGTVTFAPGQTRQTVSVEVLGDIVPEANENFSVRLANAVNAGIADDTAIGTIVNDDGIVINDVVITEGSGAGTTTASFTVSLLSASAGTVTVNFATAGGTAESGTDFTAASGTLTFAPGETSKTVAIAINRDTAVESDEGFSVTLSGASGGTIVDGTGLGTIINDDGFVVNDVSQFEGSGSGTTPFVFSVKLLSALTANASVSYQVVGSSATAGSDFVAASGTLNFTAGQTQQQVTVNVNRDTAVETDETFQFVLANPTITGLADATGIGTIRNDDGIYLSDAYVVEGQSGTSSMLFTVTLSSAASAPITVDYATTAGTATAGTDYTTTNGTLTFAVGEVSKTITVPVTGDTVPEPDETVNLVLSNASGSGIVDNAGVGTIRNDDGLSVSSPSSLSEGNSGTRTVGFVVSLSAAATQQVKVDYGTVDGTATAGSDYVAASGTLTFAPGETSKTVNVTLNGDTIYEPNETFRMQLSNPVGSVIVNGSGTAIITNDDAQPPPVLYISDVSQTEGTGAGSSSFNFFVTLSRAASSTVTVNYATAAGTATSGADFTPVSGTLSFAAGETSKVIVVPVNRDASVEGNETFTVALSGVTGGATLDRAAGLGTIRNDDVTLSVNDISLREGNAGNTTATFTISLSGASPLPVSVDYATGDGSATSPGDYASTTGTVTFAPGEASRQVTVQVVGDSTIEPNETIRLTLSNPVYATITRSEATATLTNDDPPPVPVIVQVTDDTGWSASDRITKDVTQTLQISALAGTTVRVYDGNTLLGTAVEGPSGSFSFTTPALGAGVHALKVNATDNEGNASGFATAQVTIDLSRPILMGLDPADESTRASTTDDLTLFFNEAVQYGAGSLVLKTGTGSVVETIDNSGGRLSFSGNTVAVNPATTLSPNTAYVLEIGSDVLRDLAGNAWAGTTTYNFTTGGARFAGTSGPDLLVGDAFANRLQGFGGNDTIQGQGGIDIAVYAGQRSNFSLLKTAGGWTVTDNTGSEGSDGLTGIERLQFANTSWALDFDGNAAKVAKLIGALFGVSALQDKALVGEYLNQMDQGASYEQVAGTMAASDRFGQLAGSHSNTDFVRLVYTNVVGVPPSPADLATYVPQLDAYALTQAELAVLAADTTLNQARINLSGLTLSGLAYTAAPAGTVPYGTNGADNLAGTVGNDHLYGLAGNDTFTGGLGNDTIEGAAGIDTSVYAGTKSDFTLTKGAAGWTVQDTTGIEGTDTLTGVERLTFSNVQVALDLDGAAGMTAKILGAVFGAAAVQNKQFVGIGLSVFDGGMTYEQVAQLALDAKLGIGHTHKQAVDLMWENLVGSPPTPQISADLVAAIEVYNVYTEASLAVAAAEHPLNVANIDLVGLTQTGLEFA